MKAWKVLSVGAVTAAAYLIYQRLRRRHPENHLLIHIVGDCFTDVLVGPVHGLPEWGMDTLVQRPIQLMPGGSGLNTAVHMSNLEWLCPLQCHLHTRIGQDAIADFLTNFITRWDISLYTRTSPKDNDTPLASATCIVLSGAADRCFITHRGALANFSFDHVNLSRLYKADHIHMAGFFNLPKLAARMPRVLEDARIIGITTSLNPQYDATNKWEGLEESFPFIDVFLANRLEITNITEEKEPEEAALSILKKGVDLVVVTLGSKGAIALQKDGDDIVKFEQTCKKAEVVDTTGAGDAFNAAFLSVWKKTGDVQEALRYGCALGTTLVTVVGASPTLTEGQIREYLPSL